MGNLTPEQIVAEELMNMGLSEKEAYKAVQALGAQRVKEIISNPPAVLRQMVGESEMFILEKKEELKNDSTYQGYKDKMSAMRNAVETVIKDHKAVKKLAMNLITKPKKRSGLK